MPASQPALESFSNEENCAINSFVSGKLCNLRSYGFRVKVGRGGEKTICKRDILKKLLPRSFMASKELCEHIWSINYSLTPTLFPPSSVLSSPTIQKNFLAFLIIYCMYAEVEIILRLRARELERINLN